MLQGLANRGAAASLIAFEGWAGGEARRALLAQAGIFALPSSQENFGVAMVEAMAAGTPVVITPGVNLAPEIDAAGAGWIVELDQLSDTLAEGCDSTTMRRMK